MGLYQIISSAVFCQKSKIIITKHIFYTIYIIEDERYNRKIEFQQLQTVLHFDERII